MVKYIRLRWAVHVAWIKGTRNAYKKRLKVASGKAANLKTERR
jgi:hypothetical protein